MTIVSRWRTAKLGELVAFKTGKLDSNAAVPNGDYPFFTCSQETLRTNSYSFDTECVLLAGNNANGIFPLKYFHGKFDAYQRTYVVTTRDANQLTNKFLFYALRPKLSEFRSVSTGAATKFLTLTILNESKIQVPPLTVQRRIAGVLSAYDELIENSQRRIRILEAMARTLYREWFVHFRFPGHENVSRVASPLGDIPQGWEVVSLDEVCERVTDGSHSSPKSVEEGLPMASSKDMHDWGLTLDTCRFIGREDFDQLARNGCKPKKNDVLITKDGANYLKYIFVNRAEQELVLLSSIAILRPNARINPHLLAAILKLPENKGRLKNYVTGAAIPRIVLKDFKRFQFMLPSKAVQMHWAKVAETLTEFCWRLVDQIQNLRRTRDLLLPRLLSGQVILGENNG